MNIEGVSDPKMEFKLNREDLSRTYLILKVAKLPG